MRYIRKKSGDVLLDLKNDITLEEGDEIVCETNEPEVFYGTWMNPANDEDGDINELNKRQNKYERKLSKDQTKTGFHMPSQKTGSAGRRCAYCGKLLGDNARANKKYCNKKCRQNDHYRQRRELIAGKDKPEKSDLGMSKGVEEIK